MEKRIMEEMQAIKKNNTWDVVHTPKDKVPVGCKWVFTVKYKVDGSIEQYNARLVAKGYTQTYDIDFKKHRSCCKNKYNSGSIIIGS